MDIIRDCEHKIEAIDSREGHTVCISCGLVLSESLFCHNEMSFPLSHGNQKWQEKAKDLLDRINIPTRFSENIVKYFETNYAVKNETNFLFSVYSVLNKQLGFVITLKDLAYLAHSKPQKLFSQQPENEIINIEKNDLVDRYCTLLSLSFEIKTLIKEFISEHYQSGHTPLTVIAGSIYLICKKQKLKITAKKIASVVGVSPISIQRFVKHVGSQR